MALFVVLGTSGCGDLESYIAHEIPPEQEAPTAEAPVRATPPERPFDPGEFSEIVRRTGTRTARIDSGPDEAPSPPRFEPPPPVAPEPPAMAERPRDVSESSPIPARPSKANRRAYVELFFATDRAPLTLGAWWYARRFLWTGVAAIALWLWIRRGPGRRPLLRRAIAALMALVTVALGMLAGYQCIHFHALADRLGTLFGPERSRPVEDDAPERLSLGTVQVSVPPGHVRGSVERPCLWSGDFFVDPERHFAAYGVQLREDQDFYARLSARVAASTAHDAFVFVHGYNVTFEDAVLRTAQIAYDLDFKGAPICYTWPSEGVFAKYTVDEANVDWTVPHLVDFLRALSLRTDAKIHLVAHSMGSRALTEALARLNQESGPRDRFDPVVLAAPDIDAGKFRDDIAPRMCCRSRRTTMYASSKDLALVASQVFHKYPRAGQSGDALVVVENVDTIDVSRVTSGHSYVGDSGRVLTDLGASLLRGEPPAARRSLKATPRGAHVYWVLDDSAP